MPVDDLRLSRDHYTGAASESFAAAYFLRQGYQVYLPAVQQSSVDFVIYRNGEYQAVQVKTATWSKAGAYEYLQCRVATTNKYSDGVFDLLVVIKDDDIWIIPRDELHSTNISLAGTHPDHKSAWEHRHHKLFQNREEDCEP